MMITKKIKKKNIVIGLSLMLSFPSFGASVCGLTHHSIKKDTIEVNDSTKKKLTKFQEFTKNETSTQPGMFAIHHIKNDWYFEVPDSMLGRLILTVTRFKAVPQGFKMLGGEEVNRNVVYFEKYDNKSMFLREYVQSQFAPDGSHIAKALQQAIVNPIIHKFDISAHNEKSNTYLINVSKMLLQDSKLCGMTSSDRSIVGVGSLQTDRTMVDTIQTYPINVESVTIRTYSMNSNKVPAARSGSVTLKLTTSMVLLPKEPMRARYSDERIGYFKSGFTTFSDSQQITEHGDIIERYRLEPKDKKAYRAGKLSEPVKPIVYYIDPATPKKWVPWLKKGIEDWNVAFQAAGFKNAIQAREWPDEPGMSLDDARYCVLRYLPSEQENAYGPRIVDPRSGEIIESHICWYHNVMNLLKKWYMIQCGPLDKRAQKFEFDDELMGNLIRFVSSHEVGHTLGLRHNMVASSATPVEKLRDKAWVEAHGHTVSIMDYARFNYVAQPEDNISQKGLFPRIGDYDKWAIHWGYQYRPEFDDSKKEAQALRKEVTNKLTQDPRMFYLGDEGKGADPRSQSEDLSDNNVVASDYGIKNLKRVVEHVKEWTAQPDGEYDYLNQLHRSIRAQFMKYMLHVQKNIGGRYTNNLPNKKLNDFVPRERQRQAIDWMGRHVFTTPLWLYPETIVAYIKEFKPVDEMRERQNSALSYLLAPGMLYNIYSASLLSSDPYKVDEYLNDVFAAVWKPLGKDNATQDQYRRELEHRYVAAYTRLLNPSETGAIASQYQTTSQSDIQLYVESHLEKIEKFVESQLKTCVNNDMNKRHYASLQRELQRARNKYYEVDK